MRANNTGHLKDFSIKKTGANTPVFFARHAGRANLR